MSLSADIIKARSTKLHENVIYAFKVKQFIKELIDKAGWDGRVDIDFIREKAGEGLI